MIFNVVSAVILLIIVFSLLVSAIGYISFTNSFKREYSTSTYNMAETAVTLVNGDSIDSYLANGENEEYLLSKTRLDTYCQKMKVSIVYVIKVDTSDYGSFKSVFNSVNNSVDNTEYTPWELGFERETTNDEYREDYRALYEKEIEYATVYRTRNLKNVHPHITTLVPVKDSKGNVVSLLCIQRPMRELREGRTPYLINVALSTVILAILVAISYIIYIRKEFVLPLKKVSDETERFARETIQGESLGKISKIEEISSLAFSIDEMERKMLSYIDNLTAVTSEKERIGAELSIASTIQENSIPNIFPAFPERRDFDIYASMTPAKEVGGDFYNFFLVDDDHLAMCIADVSGKGIPAALFMMVTNILISDRTHMGGSPAEIMTFVNNNICQHNEAYMFVTVWLGILEVSTGKITAVNAGHDDPAIYRKNGEFELTESKHALVVGAMENIKYSNYEIQLNKGDKLFMYTDGLPEATDKDNRMLSTGGMLAALNKCKDEKPESILKSIKLSVDEFVGDAPQFDDLTMMCIEYNGMENNMDSLTLEATNDNLDKVLAFIDTALEKYGCSMKDQMKIDLSAEEIFVNIANYAYGDNTGNAEITVENNGGAFSVTFIDSGTPYNPLEKADPDITLSAEERQIGGLGIFLVKKNMDSVSYEYKDGKNIFTMTKNI